MENSLLKVMAKLSEITIKSANKLTCWGWTYQPKAPANIKNFKK